MGGDVEDVQARRWFLEAAKHNVSKGQAYYNLATFAEEGKGGEPQSPEMALRYLRSAAAANHSQVSISLSTIKDVGHMLSLVCV